YTSTSAARSTSRDRRVSFSLCRSHTGARVRRTVVCPRPPSLDQEYLMRAATTSTLLWAAIFAAGCTKDKSDTGTTELPTSTPCQDDDGDGYCVDPDNASDPLADCNDADASIHPGATDICNGIDDNCNGIVDEGNPDSDGDGVCDGMDTETCDGIDNNGNGAIDEGFPDTDG